ncbi:MAG: glycolate oxidase subunit GlcF, partial [Burkholderiaceae bacterium]
METHLADWLRDTPDGKEAESILRKCVHCGFCTATCPTYQLLGDELDGPRGRIYLIKQVLEGIKPTSSTQEHLDRCLTCRNCESTCPSGVDYGHLVDIGRKLVDKQVERPTGQKVMRFVLREGLTRRWLFEPAIRLGKLMRPVLPASLKAKVPLSSPRRQWPSTSHQNKVLLLNGCVQPGMMPSIDSATARVLNRLGIEAVQPRNGGCCGAIRHHLDDHNGALADARRNIDAWWPALEGGATAIVMNASGCGAMVKEYGYLLRADSAYAEKARQVSELTCDLAEFLPPLVDALEKLVNVDRVEPIAFHPPCTLQHGQQVRGAVESLLVRLGVLVVAIPDSHLCCGSAGTYSITQPELSMQLRDRKLTSITGTGARQVLSANIGCLSQLQ